MFNTIFLDTLGTLGTRFLTLEKKFNKFDIIK